MLKKRRNWPSVLPVVCLFLAAACFLAGRYLHNRGNDFLKYLAVEAEGEGFESQWIKSFFAEKPDGSDTDGPAEERISFAAWTELWNETVFEASGGRSSNTKVIAVCGESYSILPFGKKLTEKDSSGCILGKGLAEKLFGDIPAEGQELLWKGQKWVVRGVVSEPSDFVMAEAVGIADEIHFDRINIILGKNEDRQLKGESFISQYGLLAHVLRFDYLGGVSWLKEMVPGKWSDFDGWKQNFREQKKAKELVENTRKSVVESVGFDYWKKGRRLFLCGIVFLMVPGGCVIRSIIVK